MNVYRIYFLKFSHYPLVLLILDVYPRSWIRFFPSRICIKVLNEVFLTQQNWYQFKVLKNKIKDVHPRCRILDLDFLSSWIPDPEPRSGGLNSTGSGGLNSTGSRIWIFNTATFRCCGSGYGIRCPFDLWILYPESNSHIEDLKSLLIEIFLCKKQCFYLIFITTGLNLVKIRFGSFLLNRHRNFDDQVWKI
jgi:hypothetical protein